MSYMLLQDDSMKNQIHSSGGIQCIICPKEVDFPLYCKECDAFYCSNCYDQHMVDFLPNIMVARMSDGHLGSFDGR